MNLQNLMKQAQSMQNNLMKAKKEIDSKEFIGKSELVEVTVYGNKKIKSIKINEDASLEKDDLEILEDMITLAVNDVMSKIDKETKEKMGSQAGMLSGLM